MPSTAFCEELPKEEKAVVEGPESNKSDIESDTKDEPEEGLEGGTEVSESLVLEELSLTLDAEADDSSQDGQMDALALQEDGWVTKDGKRYYFENGKPIVGPRNLDKKWYYFDLSDGHMLTGSQYIDGKWYRYDLKTGEMLLGSQNIDGKWYRYDPYCGYMLFGSQNIDGKWYRYDPYCGYMLFGSQNIDGKWYRYDVWTGNMLFGGQYIDGNFYWYDLWNGNMLFGWLNIYGIMEYYDIYTGIRSFQSNGLYNAWSMAQGLSSPSQYLITIDSPNCLVSVFYGSQGNWTPLYHWLCSPGTTATPTVRGIYNVGMRGYVFGSGYSCYWWTQFYGDYLFHSVLYYPGTDIIMEGVMGVPASQGCVRLDIQNAKWVYDTIPSGTTVLSF